MNRKEWESIFKAVCQPHFFLAVPLALVFFFAWLFMSESAIRSYLGTIPQAPISFWLMGIALCAWLIPPKCRRVNSIATPSRVVVALLLVAFAIYWVGQIIGRFPDLSIARFEPSGDLIIYSIRNMFLAGSVAAFEEWTFRQMLLILCFFLYRHFIEKESNESISQSGIFSGVTRLPIIGIVIFSAAIFSELHLIKSEFSFTLFASRFCLGIIAALIYLATARIWLVILLHASFNFSTDLIAYFIAKSVATVTPTVDDDWRISGLSIVLVVISFVVFFGGKYKGRRYRTAETFLQDSDRAERKIP